MVTLPIYSLPTPLSGAASMLLTFAGAALDASSIQTFPIRQVQPGRDVAVDEPGLLAVVLKTAHPGKIGTQQFAGQMPGQASWNENVYVFSVELWTKVPTPDIGPIHGFTPPSSRRLTMSAEDLMDAGWIIMGSLQYQQQQNSMAPFKAALVGPLDPVGPQGDLVGLALGVQLQLP